MMRGKQRQRGVAVITAVLIVALAVILATQIGFDSVLEQRRSETVLTMEQAFEVSLGAEAWAASYLKKDFEEDGNTRQDDPSENWATPIPPIPIDGGEIEGQLQDLQGRFNLNNLLKRNEQNQLVKNELAYRWFGRLLELLQLEAKWADVLLDRIDADNVASQPNGAEDDAYTSQTPPSRNPNMPLISASELLALPGFGPDRYRKIKPFVTALPIGTPINVCTAPGIVLDAMVPTQTQYSILSPDQFARSREKDCFPKKSDMQRDAEAAIQTLAPPGSILDGEVKKVIDDKSQYFQLTTYVTIGSTEMTLYSLLNRNDATKGQVRPILRSFGTD